MIKILKVFFRVRKTQINPSFMWNCAPTVRKQDIDGTAASLAGLFQSTSLFLPSSETAPLEYDGTSLPLTSENQQKLVKLLTSMVPGLSKHVKLVFIKPKIEFPAKKLANPEKAPGNPKISEDIKYFTKHKNDMQNTYAQALGVAFTESLNHVKEYLPGFLGDKSELEKIQWAGIMIMYCGRMFEWELVNADVKLNKQGSAGKSKSDGKIRTIPCIFQRFLQTEKDGVKQNVVESFLKSKAEKGWRFPKRAVLEGWFESWKIGSQSFRDFYTEKAAELAKALVKEHPTMMREISDFNEHCRHIQLYLNVHADKGIFWDKKKGPMVDASVEGKKKKRLEKKIENYNKSLKPKASKA